MFVFSLFALPVGRHDDGSRESGELCLLVLPGGSPVSDEMRIVLLEDGISVSGEQFSVRVNVDSLSCSGLEDHFEVLEVVAGDEDALSLEGRGADLCGNGVSVERSSSLLEQGHDLDVDLSHAEGVLQELVDVRGGLLRGQEGERFLDESEDLVVHLSENLGVLAVGAESLEAVCDELLHSEGVLVRSESFHPLDDSDGLSLCGQVLNGVELCVDGLRPGLRVYVSPVGLDALLLGELLEGGLCLGDVLGGLDAELVEEAVFVEIDVGQGREHSLENEEVHLEVFGGSEKAVLVHEVGEDLELVHEIILLGGNGRSLSADTFFILFLFYF